MIATLWSGLAFASGREGAAVGEAVALIVYATLAAIVVAIVAGACWGGYKAGKNGESVLRGSALGIGKGLLALLLLAAASMVIMTVLGILFMIYSFWSTDRLGSFWNSLVEAWNMPAENHSKGK